VPTADIIADGLTKSLSRQKHETFIHQLNLVNIKERIKIEWGRKVLEGILNSTPNCYYDFLQQHRRLCVAGGVCWPRLDFLTAVFPTSYYCLWYLFSLLTGLRIPNVYGYRTSIDIERLRTLNWVLVTHLPYVYIEALEPHSINRVLILDRPFNNFKDNVVDDPGS